MKITVLPSKSFIGENLIENLKNIKTGKNRTRPEISISAIYDESTQHITDADVVFLLPGADSLIKDVRKAKGKVIYITSQGETDNTIELPANTLIYRLPTIVGKWQEPDAGIAYLCHAVANDIEYEIKDRHERAEVLFIDDFVEEMFDALEGRPHRCDFPETGASSSDPTAPYDGTTPVPNENGKYCFSPQTVRATYGSIVDYLESFNQMNKTLIVPEMLANTFAKKLFSMFLSYLPERKMSYPVHMSVDNRGVFTELVKTNNNGQVSINIARPGNIRGQHWHNNKWEIFIVVSGHGLIQERKIGTEEVINFEVRGEEMRAVIMLPGYTHNIINLEKDRDLVTVMFANEQFDPGKPDTFFEIVDPNLKI